MKNTNLKKAMVIVFAIYLCLALTLAGCGKNSKTTNGKTETSTDSVLENDSSKDTSTSSDSSSDSNSESDSSSDTSSENTTTSSVTTRGTTSMTTASNSNSGSSSSTKTNSTTSTTASTTGTIATASVTTSGKLNAKDFFTERDLAQTADLSSATTYTLKSGEDIHITKEGVYVITGTAQNTTIYVEAGTTDKVQIVLSGASITNTNFPCIYVKTADKVFVTTSKDSSLTVSGAFKADGSTNTDAVIFSKQDLTLNGIATLTISSSDKGIVSKDDLKVTGGTYTIKATKKAISANDSIRISGGTFNITAGTDGLHAENSDDNTLGYIYICGGDFTINASSDGIQAVSIVQIDGGTINITAAEGIESTYIQINGGTINISASDDGINASTKSTAYKPTVEFNGGTTTIKMGAGDTDGVDSNGYIYVNGGTVNVTGNSTFDYDVAGEYNGGTIIANGEQITYIPSQTFGGGGMQHFGR